MTDDQDHIEELTLEAWLAGSLATADNVRVERHLQVCTECAQLLEEIELADDAIVTRLRQMERVGQFGLSSPHQDSNLWFGILAVQANLISSQQFLDACRFWSSDPTRPLADVLFQQGWLSAADRQRVDELLAERLDQRQSVPLKQNLLKDTQSESARGTVMLPPLASEKIELKQLYSTGGIGQVWMAYDHILGREVALKELLPEKTGSPGNRDRFFREARVTAQLTHPGTPPIYEFIEEDGRCWYTMKFIHGLTLTELIGQYHAEKLNHEDTLAHLIQLLNYFVAVCNTIAYAHSKQILHRDLKGDNILVGDFGEVIVLDWGLAKELSEAEPDNVTDTDNFSEQHTSAFNTLDGERLGTPAYMAPEQARGAIDEIDFRTDVYGLAALLYEILTGQPPFVGQDVQQVMQDVENTSPRSPCEFTAYIPSRLADICLQGLAKSRSGRQQTALEIGSAVQGWVVQQAQRRQTEQERELFFNLSQDLLAIHDKELRFRQTNPVWETILGWTREDLEKMSILDILHPDDFEIFSERREIIRAGNPMSKLEYRSRCKDGSYKWIRWNTTKIDGEELGYSVGHDISDIKGPCE